MNIFFKLRFCVVWLLVAPSLASATLRGAEGNSPPARENLEGAHQQQEVLDSSVAVEESESRETLESPRIIGGTTTSQGQYPYFVQWAGCGGTLIWPDVVLTAAHCNVQAQNQVIVGAYQRNSVTNGAVQRTVTDRRVHPNFSTSTDRYDFLVLKLDSAVSQTPARLNTNVNYPASNQVLTVIGMGYTVENAQQPDYLQQANVNYVDTQTCANVFGPVEIDSKITLCASVPQGGKDACQGDSGGPILDSSGTQVGVTSFGHGCGQQGYPGVYARVSGAIDWLNQQICQLSANPPASCRASPTSATASAPAPTPVSAPVSATASTSVTIRLDILYKNNPRQVSWTITNPYGAVKASSRGTGVVGKVKSSYVRLPKGTYLFNLKDGGGNSVGAYGIYASYAGRIKRLAYGTSGYVRTYQQIKFVL